jgi:hypothetical protein
MNASALRPGFANAAARLAAARTSPQERRRFRRFSVIVGGRLLDPLGREHDCRTLDMSPGDLRVAAPVGLDIGQRVVIYLESFGRLAGSVTRRGEANDFAILLEASAHKREKMAEQLTWRVNRDKLGLDEEQPIAARVGSNTHGARIELENGDAVEGQILDFSLAGMTVRALRIPPLGSWVRVSGTYGRVARRIDGGFAIDFEPKSQA